MKKFAKQLKKISQNPNLEVQDKASALLDLLKDNFEIFLKTAEEGKIAEHLNAQGFFFVKHSVKQPSFEKIIIQSVTADMKTRNKTFPKSGGVGVVIFISLVILVVLIVVLFKKQ